MGDSHDRQLTAGELPPPPADIPVTLKSSLRGEPPNPWLCPRKASREPAVDEVRAAARDAPLRGAGLRVCQYDDGAPALGDGVDLVPEAGCQQPTKAREAGASRYSTQRGALGVT